MSFWSGMAQLRTILETETDSTEGGSPLSEELMEQIRENIEALFMLFDTGDSGSATSNPPDDATGVLTDSAGGYSTDEHNGRTLLMTSGNAIGNMYTIDDTTATTLVCTGDNLYSDGVRSGDSYKVLYDVKVNADGHDHDGINSKSAVLADDVITQAKVHSSAIGQVELKSTTQSQNGGVAANGAAVFSLTGGTYCFLPQTYGSDSDISIGNEGATTGLGNVTTYATSIWVSNHHGSSARTAYVKQRYIQASGEVYWIFLKRDKLTKDVIAVSACPDHPCFGNGGKPLLRPHPFGEYDSDVEEIICINPTKAEVQAMQEATEVEAEDQPDRDLTDVITEDYEIDELSTPEWPKDKVTVALPPDWNEAWLEQRKVTVIKKVIPKPEGVLVRRLRKRN